MGIPGLTTHLKPYAVPTVVGCKTLGCELHRSSNDNSGTNIIIDGPSFAYAIYDRLLAHKPERLTGVDAIPSYDELGKGALVFLDELQSYGLNVKHIYFDGYLPTLKRRVRIDRLRQSLQKLSKYRTLPQKSAHCKTKSDTAPLHPDVVLKSGPPIPPAFHGALHAPFIVPAFLDAISSSKYAKVTSVVPGEAEAYCASVARRTGGIILSNDSDLYVHDLGLGTFGYFDSVELRATSHEQLDSNLEVCEVIELGLNSPQDVAKSFELCNLLELAYQFIIGYSQTLPGAIKSAKERQAVNHISFDDFAREYITEPSISESKCFSSEALARLSTQSQFLDPRVSELICQVESKASASHAAQAYLPSLVEDPTRSSAWLVSSGQRNFAYSICVLALKSTSGRANVAIEECNRRGQDFVKQRISLLTRSETIAYASNLLEKLRTFATTFSNIPSNLIWRLYALFEVYQWHLDSNKTPPTQELLRSALTGKVQPQLTWQTIHLSAQVQAVLYSLRMIHQILIYVASASTEPLTPILNDLAATLEDLPLLAQLMPSPFELASQTAALDIESILEQLANLLQDEAEGADTSVPLDADEPAGWERVSKKRKKSNKEKKRLDLPGGANATAKSNNVFEMLMYF